MSKEIETFFVVALNKDGSINVSLETPAESLVADRQAVNGDIYRFAKQVVDEFDRSLLIEGIVNALTPLFTTPEEPALPEKVKEALKERGITPDGE
jgi:hypothetical protein